MSTTCARWLLSNVDRDDAVGRLGLALFNHASEGGVFKTGSPAEVRALAERLNVPAADIDGALSSYAAGHMAPIGERVVTHRVRSWER